MHLLSFNFGLEGYIGAILYSATVLAFLISFFRPAVALYVLIPMLPFQNVRYRILDYPLGHSFIDLLLLASIVGSLCKGNLRFPKPYLRVPLIILAVLTYVSLWKGAAYLSLDWPLWFNDPRLSNWKNYVVVPIVILIAVYSAMRTRRQIAILLVLMCMTTAAFNRNVYNTIGQGDHQTFSYQQRAETGGIGSNGLAAFEVQFGFLLLGIAAMDRRWWLKVPCSALACFCFYCVMLSYSRGGYLAVLLGWSVLGLVKQRRLLLLLVVFLLSWQALVPNAVRERVLMTYTADGELESSAAGRVTLWQDAMDVIAVDPILGIGYDTYEFMHRVGPFNDTHNLYMKILVETGAFGLALFLCVLWRLGRLAWASFRNSTDPLFAGLGLGLFLWIWCALATNVFGDRWNYIQIVGYMWTAAAMLIRGREIEAESAAENLDRARSGRPDEDAVYAA